MRVVAFLSAYGRDVAIGAARMSRVLLEALAAEGTSIDVVAHAPEGPFELNGVRVLDAASWDWRRYERPDVIYAHSDFGARPTLFRPRWNAPYVSVVHNYSQRNAVMLRKYAPDLVVWGSETTRDYLGGSGGLVVRPPFRAADHAVPRPRPTVVSAVNLSLAKGGEHLDLLAHRMPMTRFLGVRGGWGLQHVPTARNLRVEGPHTYSRMRSVWARSRAFLAPSRAESWGMAACEALASGIPVVGSTEALGLRESVGDAGLYVSLGDLEGWERTLRELLADRELYAELSARAYARAREVEELTAADLSTFVREVTRLVP